MATRSPRRSTAPNMYVSPKFRSGSHTQLSSARRFLKTIVPAGAAALDGDSNPSHNRKRTRAVATICLIRPSAHRSSGVDARGAVWLENLGTLDACRCPDFITAQAQRTLRTMLAPRWRTNRGAFQRYCPAGQTDSSTFNALGVLMNDKGRAAVTFAAGAIGMQ